MFNGRRSVAVNNAVGFPSCSKRRLLPTLISSNALSLPLCSLAHRQYGVASPWCELLYVLLSLPFLSEHIWSGEDSPCGKTHADYHPDTADDEACQCGPNHTLWSKFGCVLILDLGSACCFIRSP